MSKLCSQSTLYYYLETSCAELVVTSHSVWKYPWHTHAHHWAIGMVCAGASVLGTRNGQHSLLQGESFVIPPNTAHSLQVTPGTTLAVICLPPGKNIEENSIALIENLQNSEFRHPLLKELSLSELGELHELALRLAGQKTYSSYEFVLTPPMQAVVELLQEKPEETFPLEYLASVAGYSQWHFLRCFLKVTGLTPHAYQLICRLRLLRKLFRADAGAAEAAVSAGFFDQSHMHKIFKLHHGLTPKQFKQACFKLEP